jgi:hypothetical protein
MALKFLKLADSSLPSGRGELCYRPSIRGAAFLGENKADRVEILRRLKEVYYLRSKAVHSGIIESKNGKNPPEKILEKEI